MLWEDSKDWCNAVPWESAAEGCATLNREDWPTLTSSDVLSSTLIASRLPVVPEEFSSRFEWETEDNQIDKEMF